MSFKNYAYIIYYKLDVVVFKILWYFTYYIMISIDRILDGSTLNDNNGNIIY